MESGTPAAMVSGLGKHILEVESADLDALTAKLTPKLGPFLRDGEAAMFRWHDEDASELLKLQTEFGDSAGSWKVRRPNLNDVFLWVAGGKTLKETKS